MAKVFCSQLVGSMMHAIVFFQPYYFYTVCNLVQHLANSGAMH